MRKLLFIIFGLIIILPLIGQNNQLEIQLSAGPSLPVGKYGSDRIEEGGYAQIGFGFELDAFLFLNKKKSLGVQGVLAIQAHDIDEEDIKADFFQSFLASSVDLISGDYNTTLVMVGPFYRFYPADFNRLGWTFRGGIGYLRGTLDNFVIDVQSEMGNFSGSNPDSQANLLSYFLGTDVIYYFGEKRKFGLRLGVLYSNARPDYAIGLPENISTSDIRNISFLNINMGFAFAF